MALAGILAPPGVPLDIARLEAMSAALVHHGPETSRQSRPGTLLVHRGADTGPLYVARPDPLVVFASEPQAIFAAGLLQRRLLRRARNDLLRWGHARGRDTLFAGIERLVPEDRHPVERLRDPMPAQDGTAPPPPETSFGEADLWRRLPEVVATLEDPVADPRLVLVQKAFTTAREAGSLSVSVPTLLEPEAGPSFWREPRRRGSPFDGLRLLRGDLGTGDEAPGASETEGRRRAALARLARAAGLAPAGVAPDVASGAEKIGTWIARRGAQLGPLVAMQASIAEICHPLAVEKLFLAAHGKREGPAAWRLLFYALWYRHHIEGRPAQQDVFATLASRM